MMKTDRLTVNYNGRPVGTLSLTPDKKLCAFEYAKEWLLDGFSISPLELPLRTGLFLTKPTPFYGNFGIYDLTRCTEGYNGEHATSVNGTGHPTMEDFIAVGTKIKMTEKRCKELIETVKNESACLRYDNT